MISIKNRHFNLHRILLLAIGLWPYQRTKLVQFQLILFSSILISYVILLFVSIYVIEEFTLDYFIKILSIGSILIVFAIMYNSFWYNFTEIIVRPLKELQNICNELRDEKEIAIIKKYGNDMKCFTLTIILFYICNLIVILPIVSLPIMRRIFEFILHINISQSHYIIYKFGPKYILGRENYLYLIVLYTDASIYIGTTAMLATRLMLYGYLKHSCGMFRIASYRIEKAINLQKNIWPKNEIIMYKGITGAVDIHRTAIKIAFVFSNLNASHFFVTLVSVICVSLNLFAISETVSHRDKVDEFLIHFQIIAALCVYFFFVNYAGQEVTDYNNDVFYTIYSVQWYAAPLRIQRLILFLLQNGTKTVRLKYGGVFMLSYELFAALTKASISYFIIMHSMQQ